MYHFTVVIAYLAITKLTGCEDTVLLGPNETSYEHWVDEVGFMEEIWAERVKI